MATAGSPSYTVPAGGGVIVSWQHAASSEAGQQARLAVYRVVDPMSYTTVGRSAAESIVPGALNSFPTRIPVQGGDVLGLTVVNGISASCEFSGEEGDNTLHTLGDPLVGADTIFANQDSSMRLNVSAVLEPDADADGYGDQTQDNCIGVANPDQADSDGDGVGDACDTCPSTADPNQGDRDGDGIGDACDPDNDDDGVPTAVDNCKGLSNPDQADTDRDGTGDACDVIDNRDLTPPDTTITSSLALAVAHGKHGRLRVTFESDEPGSTFRCSIDGKSFKPCASPKRVVAAVGNHKFSVAAVDAAGNVDPTPDVLRFEVITG